jgi:O-methyltransferase
MEYKSDYLELIKIALTDYHTDTRKEYLPLEKVEQTWKIKLLKLFDNLLNLRNFAITKITIAHPELRKNGYDWPANAYTMIGLNRLNNIEVCINKVINDNIEGDFMETGVWRGGAAIFMRAVLKDLNVVDRFVWAADSFEGLPEPNKQKYAADSKSNLHLQKFMCVTLDEVKENFRRFNLLDANVIFLKGFFSETLPTAPVKKLAILRLDGDMYESTIDSLQSLYYKVSSGGFIIVDDYNAFDFCKKAVDDFRRENKISTPIVQIDQEAVFWRKE